MTSRIAVRWLPMMLLVGWVSLAAADSAQKTIKISMTVLPPPPCTINGGNAIEVNFGEVIADHLDDSDYSRPVDINLSCRGLRKNQLRLQVYGTAANFNKSYLETNRANMAIKFTSNGKPVSVNQWLYFSLPNTPSLSAAPVMSNDSVLTGGAFNATATLYVEYQ
ncbi:fimbrial protein [Erwinia aphidicola]|nr:fimbrial protein [Erwinia aphidicola]